MLRVRGTLRVLHALKPPRAGLSSLPFRSLVTRLQPPLQSANRFAAAVLLRSVSISTLLSRGLSDAFPSSSYSAFVMQRRLQRHSTERDVCIYSLCSEMQRL